MASLNKVSLDENPINPGSWDLNFSFNDESMQGCAVPVGAPANVVVKRLRGLADIIERHHKAITP